MDISTSYNAQGAGTAPVMPHAYLTHNDSTRSTCMYEYHTFDVDRHEPYFMAQFRPEML